REFLVAWRAVLLSGVELALHDVELAIHRIKTALRLHQNHAVHAVSDVLGHHRGRAVIDVKAWLQGFEGKAFGLAWPDLRDVCTAPWSCHRMQIDGVNMMRIGGIFQVE